MTVFARNFPVGSTTASLHPVRNAGSNPRTVFPLTGDVSSSCLRFSPKSRAALEREQKFLCSIPAVVDFLVAIAAR